MKPTMTFNETLSVYRKYGIPMSQKKLTELLQENELPFAECHRVTVWTYTIWRLPFYRYLAGNGVPVEELGEYLEEIKERGWKDEWESVTA